MERDVMCKRIVSGLAAMSMVATLLAMLGTEANAAPICTSTKTLSTQTCKAWKTIGGSKYCTQWCTGSEICDNTIFGVGNINDCTPATDTSPGTCPVVTCSAFGTVDVGAGCDPTILDPRCGIQGKAFCVNPAGNASKAQGQPFTLDTTLAASGDVTDCTKNGKCTEFVELDPEDPNVLCINPKWEFKTFTASEFNAEACFCPGGFSSEATPQCCADSQRNMDGTCATLNLGTGAETCIAQRCTVDLTEYQLGENNLYTCTDLP
jgi:hypothetical protein